MFGDGLLTCRRLLPPADLTADICHPKKLFFVSLDIGNGITNGGNAFSVAVGNLDIECFLEVHNQFYGIQRVGTQIVSETCFGLYLSFFYTKLVYDDCNNLAFNF